MTTTADRPVPHRALDHDLPEVGIGARLALPAVAFTVLLTVIAAVAVALLDVPTPPGPSAAVVDAERRNVEQLADSLGAGARRDVTKLTELAEGSAPPRALADAAVRDGDWWGAEVTDAAGRTLAQAGVPVPAGPSALGVAPDGTAALVARVPTPGGVLAAVGPLRIPDGLDDVLGPVWVTDGTRPLAATPRSMSATELAAPAAPADLVAPAPPAELVARAAPAALAGPGSGAVLGAAEPGDAVPIVLHAPLRLAGTPTVLLRLRVLPLEPAGPGGQGVVAGLVLAAIALLGGLAMHVSLVRPIRRLRRSALALASGDLSAPPPRSRVAEAADLAAGFEYCRSRLTDRPAVDLRCRPRLSAWLGVTAALLAVLAWAVTIVAVLPSRVVTPAGLAEPVRERALLSADRTAASLDQGLRDVRSAAAGGPGWEGRLGDLLTADGRFLGFRLVVPDGATSRLGRPILDGVVPAADGLSVAGRNRPVPVARVTRPDGTVVVAEFDVERLAGVLASPPARARIVDHELRVVAATDGYLAFETLGDPAVRAAAREAATGPVSAGTAEAVIGGAPLARGAAGQLGWTVLVDEPVRALPLPANDMRRRAALLALPAAAVAVLVWAVYTAYQVRPLRRAARMANLLRTGDVESVIYAQGLGPGGTAVSCLDICRRAVALDSRDVLGARRLPGVTPGGAG